MSIKRFLILILLLFLWNIHGFSQSKKDVDSIKNVVAKIVREAIVTEKVKDSTAVYGLSIILEVSFKGNKQSVSINTNNPNLSPGLDFKALDKLKILDYRFLMSDRDAAKFSFKVFFIVYDSKYNQQVVNLDHVDEAVKNLSLLDEYNIPNLGLMIIRFDKKVYH